MNNMQPGRRPRSAARRAPIAPVQETYRAREAPEWEAHAWEDTATVTEMAPVRPSGGRPPRVVWIVAAAVFVVLFIVALVAGINAWRDYEIARAEARRIQQLAEEKAKYKFLYRDMIEDYAYEQGIHPALVASVIYHESRFDPEAVSSVGARGLMQIMKDTGQWISEKLDEESSYTQDSLFNAETSIRFGCWYLGFLSRRFEGDIRKIAAGYHAGQGQVGEWLDDPRYSPDGKTLKVIPFASTDQYVSRVVNAYDIYIKHYYTPEETPEPIDGAP